MQATKDRFDSHRLENSFKPVRLLAVIAGVFNLFLLLPDLINTGRAAAPYFLLLRIGYSVLAAVFVCLLKKIKTFHILAILITILEIFAVVQFLIVLTLYPSPDFLIQLLAFLILVVFILIVPNYLALAVITACLGAAAFLFLAYEIFTQNRSYIIPGAVYLGLLILTGAVYKGYAIHNQKHSIIQMSQMAAVFGTDPLTDTGTRNLMSEIGDDLIKQFLRQGLSISLVFIDVDNLKPINDAFGHKHGDLFLKEIAATIRRHLRHNDIFVRWGGDEFILLLPDVDIINATNLAERIRIAIQRIQFEGNIAPSSSFGVAALKPDQSLDSLIEEADQAMYNAKKLGKNKVAVSSSGNIHEPDREISR